MDLTWRDFYRSPYLLFLPFMLVVGLYVELAPLWMPDRVFLHENILNNAHDTVLFATACLGGTAAYFLLLPLRKGELWLVFVVGGILEALLISHRLQFVGPWGQLLQIGPGLIVGVILAILWRLVSHWRLRDGAQFKRTLEILGLTLAMPFFLTAGTTQLHSDLYVYDPHCYALDSLWGFQPSFVITKPLRSFQAVRVFMYIIYFFLSLWMMLAQVVVFKENEEAHISHWRRLVPAIFFALIACFGGLSYEFVPAVGTDVYCGSNLFPNGPWIPPNPDPQPVQAPPIFSRSTIPSLHLGWILSVYYSLYLSRSLYRHIALGLVILTAFSTFSVGSHWLLDLILACPFTVAILALCAVDAPAKLRWLIGSSLAILFCLGVYLLKFHTPLLMAHRGYTLTGFILTVLVSLYLGRLISKARAPKVLSPQERNPQEGV